MARITSKASLNHGTEYTVDTGASTLQLSVAGNLSAGSANGVDRQALYSALVDYWKSAAGLNAFQFPFRMVDGPIATMLELREGWTFADATSISLLRNCGFAYKDTSDVVQEEYACFVQLGTVNDAADQPYYLIDGTVPVNFGVADEFNECIQIYDNGVLDYRATTVSQFFVREAGDTYGGYDLQVEQGFSTLEPRAYFIPMTTATDPNIVTSSPSGSPYSGMTLTLGATTNTINGTSRDFAEGEIEANGGTVQQVYDWFQDLLLSTSDIDSGAGTARGNTYLDGSLSFAGGIITTSQGLTIKNIAAADASNIIHVDDTGTNRQEPVSASIGVSGMPTAAGATTRLQISNETAKAASAWATGTGYSLGDKVLRSTGVGTEQTAGLYMVCTTAGTSHASNEPTWDTTVGNTTADNTVTWTTYAILYYDDDPASATYAGTYTNNEEFATGDSFRVRFAELDADTSFKSDEATGVHLITCVSGTARPITSMRAISAVELP